VTGTAGSAVVFALVRPLLVWGFAETLSAWPLAAVPYWDLVLSS